MIWPTIDGRCPVLRCVAADGVSRNRFTWPLEVGAHAEAPDWDPNPGRDCGGGLHGLLWGCGDVSLLAPMFGVPMFGVWLVVLVDPADVATPLGDDVPPKVRFRRCEVAHVGDRESAVGWLCGQAGASGLPIAYGTASAGHRGVLIITHWDSKAYRRKVAEVDGKRIKAGVAYQLNAAGEFVEVDR